MGYTHYWDYTPKQSDKENKLKVLEELKELLIELPEHCPTAGGYHDDEPILIRGGNGQGEPTFDEHEIWFNGTSENDLDHETFYFQFENKKDSFNFCKTARKPYDFVVCLCLISLQTNLEGFKFSSDGGKDDWLPAIEYYERKLNRKVDDGILGYFDVKTALTPVCSKCGSTDVDIRCWVHQPTGELDYPDMIEDDDTWCRDCDSHSGVDWKESYC